MGKKPRPKSKEEKLQERRKHYLDEKEEPALFLDEGGEDDDVEHIDLDEGGEEDVMPIIPNDEDEDMPEEISTKKSEQSHEVPFPEKKKKRKRKIKKEGPGVFKVESENVKIKVVAAASKPIPSQLLEPSINFKELLFQESTKERRRNNARANKHVEKWIKRR